MWGCLSRDCIATGGQPEMESLSIASDDWPCCSSLQMPNGWCLIEAIIPAGWVEDATSGI
jgi:hypothetical protein